jgi:hypothetical protein
VEVNGGHSFRKEAKESGKAERSRGKARAA